MMRGSSPRTTINVAACTAALAFCLCASAANSPVSDAAMKGDKAALRSLLEQKADVNAPQTDGATAIQWASYGDDMEMAGLLISAGANVKLATREGATALYLASIHGNPAMIDKLLNAGADPNERGPEGETPLMLASRAGNLDAIKVLLDHKADINAKDKIRGTTALMWATEQAHPAAVQLLIARGANVSAATEPDTRNYRNNLANTVTQRLNSSFGAVGQAKARVGAAPGSPAPAGGASGGSPKKTPDGEAGGDDVAIFFGPPRKKDGGGLTPLVYAARADCLECAKTLLDAGADVNQRTHYGWTALLTATQNRHYKLAAYLLDHGANRNLANNGGRGGPFLVPP